MNPQDQDPNAPAPTSTPHEPTAYPAEPQQPEVSAPTPAPAPQTDEATMQTIDALESENRDVTNTSAPTSAESPASSFDAEPVTPVTPQPASVPEPTAQPTTEPSPVVAAGLGTQTQPPAPVQTPASFGPPAPKKSQKLVIILAVAILVIAGAIAGFFVWQSMNTTDTTTDTTTSETAPEQETGGDLPGGDGVDVQNDSDTPQ